MYSTPGRLRCLQQNQSDFSLHEEINGNNMRITRGIYIEDTLYVIQGNIIEAYSLKDFKKVDDIIL